MPLTQGYLPSTTASDPGGSSWSWVNVANANVRDSISATFTTTAGSGQQFLYTRGYKFAIPAGSTINAASIRVRCSETASARELNVSAFFTEAGPPPTIGNAVLSGLAIPDGALGDVAAAADEPTTALLSPTIINSAAFGVLVVFDGTSGSGVEAVSVDCVEVQISYTPPDGGPPLTTTLVAYYGADGAYVPSGTLATEIRDQSGNQREMLVASGFRGADLFPADTDGPLRLAFNHDGTLGVPDWGAPQSDANTSRYEGTFAAIANTNFTVYALIRQRQVCPMDASGNFKGQYLLFGTDGANTGLRLGFLAGRFLVSNPNAGAGQLFTYLSSPATLMVPSGLSAMVFRGDGNRLRFTINGRTYDAGAGSRSQSGQTLAIALGSQGPGGSVFGNFWAGDLIALAWYSGSHTDNEVAQMLAWAQSKVQAAPESLPVLTEGDSNTAGVKTTRHKHWPSLSRVCRTQGCFNIAVGGGHVSTGIASLASSTRIQSTSAPNKIDVTDTAGGLRNPSWLVVAVGLNDTRANRSGLTPDTTSDATCASDVYSALVSYVAARRAAGHERIFVCHVTDNYGNNSGSDTATLVSTARARNRKNLLNALIDAGAAANNYTVVPWGRDPRIGIDGASANTTYFNVDQLHHTNAGQQVRADIFDAVFNSAGGLLSHARPGSDSYRNRPDRSRP